MLKVIGAIALFGAVAVSAAVYSGVLDFSAEADITPKGKTELQELRNDTADLLKSAGDAAAEAARD